MTSGDSAPWERVGNGFDAAGSDIRRDVVRSDAHATAEAVERDAPLLDQPPHVARAHLHPLGSFLDGEQLIVFI
jgi:hypothetical protein